MKQQPLSQEIIKLIEDEARSQMGLPPYLPLESFAPSMKAGYDMFMAGLQFALTDPAILSSLKGGEWVSVDERLPEKDINPAYSVEVLVTTTNLYNNSIQLHGIAQYYFEQDCWIHLHFEPTHWMPLPTPPKP